MAGQEITLEPIRSPGPFSRRLLSRLPVTPFYSGEQAITDAEQGRLQLVGVRINGTASAVVLLGRSGDCLDAVAVAGDLGGPDGLPDLVGKLADIARENGLSGVVCRTTRKGLGRRLMAIGAAPIETIYRMQV